MRFWFDTEFIAWWGEAVSEHAKSCHGGCEGTGMLPCLPCDRLETAKDRCEEPVPCPVMRRGNEQRRALRARMEGS